MKKGKDRERDEVMKQKHLNRKRKEVSEVMEKGKIKEEKMQYCKKCVMPSTRPRITFNKEGVCNACQWAEAKKTTVDWDARWNELEEICDKYRCDDGSNWDVIVPCSGGKDGSYVAWTLKHKLGMHPLCVTLMPEIQTDLGRRNLHNFINSGFDHIAVTPEPSIRRKINKKGFINYGRPMETTTLGFSSIPLKVAVKFNIPFIIWGEEGESEYGGTSRLRGKADYSIADFMEIYLSGTSPEKYVDDVISLEDLKWWSLPSKEEAKKVGLFLTHWSYFENWDPYLHYKIASEKCGLQTSENRTSGTYTNYAQLDDKLQNFHLYMMYIKFGFGRVTADASIDIRAGRMNREEAVELVKELDSYFPEEDFEEFLDYIYMNENEFWKVVDKFANREVLEKVDGKWRLKASVVKGLEEGGGEFRV